MDGVQAVLLGAGGQIELALGGAVLALNAPGQVLLGGVGHVGLERAAQELGELGGVLGFLKGGLFPVQANFGIALAVGDAGHAEIHADFGALAGEVGLQLLQDVLLVFLGDVVQLGTHAEDVLSGQLDLALDLGELGAGNAADRALEIGGHLVAFIDVAANGANISSFYPPKNKMGFAFSCPYRILDFREKVKQFLKKLSIDGIEKICYNLLHRMRCYCGSVGRAADS